MDYDKNHKLRTWQIVPEQEGNVIAFSKVRGGMGAGRQGQREGHVREGRERI